MYLYLIMKKMFHEITLKRLYVKFFLKNIVCQILPIQIVTVKFLPFKLFLAIKCDNFSICLKTIFLVNLMDIKHHIIQ